MGIPSDRFSHTITRDMPGPHHQRSDGSEDTGDNLTGKLDLVIQLLKLLHQIVLTADILTANIFRPLLILFICYIILKCNKK